MFLYLFILALVSGIFCGVLLASRSRKKRQDEISRLEVLWKEKVPQAIEEYNSDSESESESESKLSYRATNGSNEFRVLQSQGTQFAAVRLPPINKNIVSSVRKNNDQLTLFSVDSIVENDQDCLNSFVKKPLQPQRSSIRKKSKNLLIQLYVKRESGEPIDGSTVVRTLNKVGLSFGKMSIFHYVDFAQPDVPSVFSAANMHEPGTFDMDRIEILKSEGIVFFMNPSEKTRGKEDFSLMLSVAQKLAKLLKANLYSSSEVEWGDDSEKHVLAVLDDLNG
jgi:FtsZ-interacting cell division protein ZipA